MHTPIHEQLSPTMARQLGAVEGTGATPPSFLNWVVEETDRLHRKSTPTLRREERFTLQNQAATLAGAAYGYGQWLYAVSEL